MTTQHEEWPMPEDGPVFLIWSNEHRRWWGPYERGYVGKVSEAGRYSRERALAICGHAMGTSFNMGIPAELPVRLEDVKDFIVGRLLPECLT
jgi:hypothetical protein